MLSDQVGSVKNILQGTLHIVPGKRREKKKWWEDNIKGTVDWPRLQQAREQPMTVRNGGRCARACVRVCACVRACMLMNGRACVFVGG